MSLTFHAVDGGFVGFAFAVAPKKLQPCEWAASSLRWNQTSGGSPDSSVQRREDHVHVQDFEIGYAQGLFRIAASKIEKRESCLILPLTPLILFAWQVFSFQW
jgi:hypothetical protein